MKSELTPEMRQLIGMPTIIYQARVIVTSDGGLTVLTDTGDRHLTPELQSAARVALTSILKPL